MAHPQFTIELEDAKKGLYSRIPHALPFAVRGRRLKRCARNLLASIYTYTREKVEERYEKDEKGKDKLIRETKRMGYRFTYDQVQKELGRGRSTVACAFEELRDLELIQKIDRDGSGTQYVYMGDPVGGQFYVVPLYLYTMKAKMAEGWRTLTDAEVYVLSYMMTECSSPANKGNPRKGGGTCETSYRMLARKLGLAQSTVRRAISALLEGKFIRRQKRFRGKNRHQLSKYEVSVKLFIYKKYVKRYPSEEEYMKIRTEYYADLRAESEARAEKFLRRANRSEVFKNIVRRLNTYPYKLAKAEIAGDQKEYRRLKNEEEWYQKRRLLVLERMGIDEDDLVVQRNCTCCNDTGQVGAKRCGCFPGGNPWER